MASSAKATPVQRQSTREPEGERELQLPRNFRFPEITARALEETGFWDELEQERKERAEINRRLAKNLPDLFPS